MGDPGTTGSESHKPNWNKHRIAGIMAPAWLQLNTMACWLSLAAPSPGWPPVCASAWQAAASTGGSGGNRGRRLSAASDSGDTGIGTSCSDSIEDHLSSSGTLSFRPIRAQTAIPTAHVMPSTSGSQLGTPLSGSAWSTCLTLPTRRADPLDSPLDMKDPRPPRRWSSLTRLSAADRHSPSSKGETQNLTGGSVTDQAQLYSCQLDHSHRGMEPFTLEDPQSHPKLLPISGPRCNKYANSNKADIPLPSPLKPSSLDLTYSALPESKAVAGQQASGQRCLPLGHQAMGGSPIQPAVRTQMWLSEQMHSNPVDYSRPAPQGLCAVAAWQQEQQLQRLRKEAELMELCGGAPLQVDTIMKIKEGLLRQKELVIDRQKQQIFQLHEKIRENELRAQQVIQGQCRSCEDPYLLKMKESQFGNLPLQTQCSERPNSLHCENGEVERQLATAEREVTQFSEFLKQNTQKYTEEIKKLEEKLKTRDKYISSLKKKCQRESEQSQEKQQRIETLEKYLADLPSLEDVENQAQQLAMLQGKADELQGRASELEQRSRESQRLLQEKEDLLESQRRKEKELIAAVQSLQQKVERCLEDGVRLPMLDTKQLESDNFRLQEQHSRNIEIIDNQKKQIERLTSELTASEKKLLQERAASQELRKQLAEKEDTLKQLSEVLEENQNQRQAVQGSRSLAGGQRHAEQVRSEMPAAVGQLLKEMSLCLLDLRALCSILTQRAQGQEPNLALLLGIKSMSCSGEENENVGTEESLNTKLTEVCQLRKDIDELRTIISDRYAQDMGDNCITQ
ncbi:centrosomal protein of 85 kDa-like isoform X1 [Lepisosteus oculatus]|uniref:centrosomal protein of 85 kDa-like isoform X1 n=2 Tax=Lepisosteus oculatus TaxID=7918 RepID=UPI0035F52CA4